MPLRFTEVQPVDPRIARFRELRRHEMACQIVHDSIHRRDGWCKTLLISTDDHTAGFVSLAVGGPWKDKPTVFEMYLMPAHRPGIIRIFEAFLSHAQPAAYEVQTHDMPLTAMIHRFGIPRGSEKMVFAEGETTRLAVPGVRLRLVTDAGELAAAIQRRQGGGEWKLELGGLDVGSGGILFHYNLPYGDVYMDISPPHRRRGLGSWLVQELKRECRALGQVPCARCNVDNIASQLTLQRAGFVPSGHILIGEFPLAGLSGMRDRGSEFSEPFSQGSLAGGKHLAMQ